jgi:transposase-like protein
MKVTLEKEESGGERGRGAAGKTPVFGLLKRNGKVLCEHSKTLQERAITANNRG